MKEGVLFVHGLSRVTVAFVWIYHGLVPKILGPHRDELYLAVAHGMSSDSLTFGLLKILGAIEIIFGIVLLIFWNSRWPFVISAAVLALLLADVAVVAPEYLLATFNPISLNISVISLSIIGFVTTKQVSAEHT